MNDVTKNSSKWWFVIRSDEALLKDLEEKWHLTVPHRVKSFKNIAKTLATHHQYLVTYYLNSASAAGESPFCKETEVGVGTHYM